MTFEFDDEPWLAPVEHISLEELRARYPEPETWKWAPGMILKSFSTIPDIDDVVERLKQL